MFFGRWIMLSSWLTRVRSTRYHGNVKKAGNRLQMDYAVKELVDFYRDLIFLIRLRQLKTRVQTQLSIAHPSHMTSHVTRLTEFWRNPRIISTRSGRRESSEAQRARDGSMWSVASFWTSAEPSVNMYCPYSERTWRSERTQLQIAAQYLRSGEQQITHLTELVFVFDEADEDCESHQYGRPHRLHPLLYKHLVYHRQHKGTPHRTL